MKKISRILCLLLAAGLLLAGGCKPEGAKQAESLEFFCLLPYTYNTPGSLTADEYVRFLSNMKSLLLLEDGSRVEAAEPEYELSFTADGAKAAVPVRPDDYLWSGGSYRLVLRYELPENVVLPAGFSEKNVVMLGIQTLEKLTPVSAKAKAGKLELELGFDWAFTPLPIDTAELRVEEPVPGNAAAEAGAELRVLSSLWRGGYLQSVDVAAEITECRWREEGVPAEVFGSGEKSLSVTVKVTDPNFRFGLSGQEGTQLRVTVGPDVYELPAERIAVVQMMADVLVLQLTFPAVTEE